MAGRGRPPFTEDVARDRLLAAYYRPVAPYPGHGSDRWPALCLLCGATVAVRAVEVRAARGRCAHAKNTVMTPPPPYWEAVTLDNSEAAALAVLERAQYEPCEPYPGAAVPWTLRCRLCGVLVSLAMHAVRVANDRLVGERRTECHHRPHTLWRPTPTELARLFPARSTQIERTPCQTP